MPCSSESASGERTPDIEVRCHGFSDIRESGARADAACVAMAQCEDRTLLASVVRPVPCRITAVVGGDDEKVVRTEPVDQLGKPPIELLERQGVAGRIAPVAVDRVEIDEVCKQQPAVFEFVRTLERAIKQRVVSGTFQILAGAGSAENVGDLAD